MKKFLLIAVLFIPCIKFTAAQTMQPSEVEKTENLGEYQKVSYISQNATYKNREYREAYDVNGFRLFFSPQSTVIIAPNEQEIYSSYSDYDGWAAHPTFYFPKNKNKPFVISVENGMEEYWGSDIYVIDKDYCCTFAGHLDITPSTDKEYSIIEDALRLNDQGKKGIRFTFACDSLISIPAGDSRFSDLFSSNDIYFTFVNNTLKPSPKWNRLRGVQRKKLYENIEEPVLSVHYFDIDNDGNEDMLYVLPNRKHHIFDEEKQKMVERTDGTSIIICLCKDWEVKEELIFDFDEPIDVDYRYDNRIIHTTKRGSGSAPQQYDLYRLEGKELVQLIPQ